MTLTIAITKAEEGGWAGQIEEFPAVIDQGETIEELKANLAEGLRFYLDTQRWLFEKNHAGEDVYREELTIVG